MGLAHQHRLSAGVGQALSPQPTCKMVTDHSTDHPLGNHGFSSLPPPPCGLFCLTSRFHSSEWITADLRGDLSPFHTPGLGRLCRSGEKRAFQTAEQKNWSAPPHWISSPVLYCLPAPNETPWPSPAHLLGNSQIFVCRAPVPNSGGGGEISNPSSINGEAPF